MEFRSNSFNWILEVITKTFRFLFIYFLKSFFYLLSFLFLISLPIIYFLRKSSLLALIGFHLYISRGISFQNSINCSYEEFVDTYSKKLNLKYEFEGLENLPKSGPVIIYSNHAGAYENEFLCNEIDKFRGRKGSKYLTYLSNQVPRALGVVMSEKDRERLIPGGREIIAKHLRQGEAMVIFPAGVIEGKPYWVDFVERYKQYRNPFKRGFIYIALQNKCDLIPAYVSFKHPLWMCIFSLVSPKIYVRIAEYLQPIMAEGKTVRVKFGKPIPFSELEIMVNKLGYKGAAELLRYNLYYLGFRMLGPPLNNQ